MICESILELELCIFSGAPGLAVQLGHELIRGWPAFVFMCFFSRNMLDCFSADEFTS